MDVRAGGDAGTDGGPPAIQDDSERVRGAREPECLP